MSLSECKAECLRNCNCTAYANPYITRGGSGCLIWFGNLIDTKDVNEADSKQSIYIRVSASEASEAEISTYLEKEKEKERPIKLMLISMIAGVLVSGFINGAILLKTRRKMRVLKKNEDLELPVFKWTIIVAATNDFSRENIIGEGGFGPVYRAWLLWKENKIVELMDECLSDTFVESEVKRCVQVGLLCVQKYAEDRPVMSSVLLMLGTEGANLPEPKEPGFFMEGSSSAARSCTSDGAKYEKQTMSITDLEAR
ncbi:UNVERIFIED_CONTAM: Receptor-like serine/threonine-protein kinase SD1-6 [Sesamum radiatum]|uniref:Receptor-like serine/threonine-protein kinase SD1-6 n=1 Tax=Sesamum radiatum TaxID=300843 RepID=A0AAW2LNH3_SESRA